MRTTINIIVFYASQTSFWITLIVATVLVRLIARASVQKHFWTGVLSFLGAWLLMSALVTLFAFGSVASFVPIFAASLLGTAFLLTLAFFPIFVLPESATLKSRVRIGTISAVVSAFLQHFVYLFVFCETLGCDL